MHKFIKVISKLFSASLGAVSPAHQPQLPYFRPPAGSMQGSPFMHPMMQQSMMPPGNRMHQGGPMGVPPSSQTSLPPQQPSGKGDHSQVGTQIMNKSHSRELISRYM